MLTSCMLSCRKDKSIQFLLGEVNQSQNVVVFRYVLKGRVFERFWSFSSISEANAQNLSGNIISCLEHVLPNSDDDHKLVAQCYDGASVMRGDQRLLCKTNTKMHTMCTVMPIS